MPYTSITLSAAATLLAARLMDTSNIHWTSTELYNSIRESLRILQSLTGFTRTRSTFNTVNTQIFYDLRTVISSDYAFTITDTALLAEIQAHLNEPVANPWTGTAQFTLAVINSALQRARDQFLGDTGIYTTRTTTAGPTPTASRLELSQSLLDIRRAAWKDSVTNLTYSLVRMD